jgi:hypothetical protein
MACRSCRSENQTEVGAEMNIHFPGRKGLDKPPCSHAQSSLFAWIAALRSLRFQKPSCVH